MIDCILDPVDVEEIAIPLSALRLQLDPEVVDPAPYENGIQELFPPTTPEQRKPRIYGPVPQKPESCPESPRTLDVECVTCGGRWTNIPLYPGGVRRREVHIAARRCSNTVLAVMEGKRKKCMIIGSFPMPCATRSQELPLKHFLICRTCEITWESLAPFCEHEHAIVSDRFRAVHVGHDIDVKLEVTHW